MSAPLYIVAIDPGMNTGVAVYSVRQDRVLDWYSRDFFTVQDFLVNSFEGLKDQVIVYVETPAKMLYARNTSGIRKDELRIMYHSGGNRREAILLAGAIERLGFTVKAVTPIRETKWTQERMELVTRSRKRSNEHERDATRLAQHYGREERLRLRIKS